MERPVRCREGKACFEKDESFGFLGFFLCSFVPLKFSLLLKFPPPVVFYCRLVLTGEVWLDQNQICPSSFFFYFKFILKTNDSNVDLIRKISDCKINA
jgi:hypothetical protein